MSEDEVKISRGVLGDWARSIAEAAVILAALFVFFWPARVKGVSMAPSVNDGDRVIICRLAGYAGLYGRGDLVVFDDDAYSENMIKRVIAVGGDTLRISGGQVSTEWRANTLLDIPTETCTRSSRRDMFS